MADHGTFYWNELMTRAPDKAKAFYAETLGWAFDAMPMPGGGTYWVCMQGDRPAGGVFEMSDPMFDGAPEQWFAYIAVDDVDARCAKVQAAGGVVARPPWDVPGVGRIAVVRDANGAAIGLMTPAPMPG